MIIAIDGPAASGKGTLAKRIAAHLRLPHLDTGLLYRAVGQQMVDRGLDMQDGVAAGTVASQLSIDWLVDERLRSGDAGKAASVVAVVPAVRAALKQFQVDFAHQDGGAVLDGRDIGTVIAPDADVKIWITASPEVRANRRYLELIKTDPAASEAQLLHDLQARDARDAPNMIRAADAVVLDTSNLDKDGVLRAALDIVEKREIAASKDAFEAGDQ
ncbi:MAG: (d)CMP kinase [Beijerinckiaceae bacterium]